MNEIESVLVHGKPYDAVAAREYYLRTRHLKGRRAGVQRQPVGRPKGSAQGPHPKGHKSSEQLRKEAHARQAALQKRLDHLRDVLAKLVKQAKANSGSPAKHKPKSAAEKSADAKGKSPLTAKQKRDAAKRSKKSYEKNKKPASPDSKDLQKQIKEVEAKIRKIRAQLKAAVEHGRKQSHPQTASKGR